MNYLHTTLVSSGGMEAAINATFKIITKTATKYTSIEDITNDVNNFIGYECVSPLVGEDLFNFDDWYGSSVKSAIYNGEASITSEKISLGNVLVTENDGTKNTVIPVVDYLHMDEVTTAIPRISVDLATAFPDKWAALTPGEHTIQIRAKNPGNYLDSDLSTAITFVKVVNYTITANLTNCAGVASNPTTIASNTTGTVLTFTANTGYDLPASVTVTGATSSWNQSTGELTLTKPTGNVTITIAATAKTYNITVNATNATAASTNPTTIVYGAGAQLKFTFPDGYYAPTAVTVTGATQIWDAGTGALTLSNCTGPVTVTIEGAVKTYTITPAITNCTWNGTNPTTIASNQFTPIQLDVIKNTGWTLPSEISVSGVDAKYWSWNQSTGIVTISHPQGNVTVTVNAVREVYNITTTLENALADPSNPSTIGYGTTATLKFTFPADYTAPDDADVAVTGATKQWTKSTGTLVLSNPTANVTVQVAGVWELKELTGTYTWKETIPEATWTEQLVNFALADGTSYKKMYWTDNGTTYNLYYDDMLEGGSETKVYSYDADAQTGTWVDPKYRIVNFTSEDVQYVPANFYNYVIANTTQATQLSTPQNVTANGTAVSWDEVENATSYEVIEGGNNVLGTVENVTEDALAGTWVFNDTVNVNLTDATVNFKDLNQKQYNEITKLGLSIVYGFINDTGEQDSLSAYVTSGGRGWTDPAYKTVTITSKLSEVTNGETLLAWLQANATKQ